MDSTNISKIVRVSHVCGGQTPASIVSNMKTRQMAKIRELRQALAKAGVEALDHQASVLGLSRSTAWAVLKGNHKASGLSGAVIKRMLASPRLPPSARTVLLEYVEQKSAGAYGHSKRRVIAFRAQIEESRVGEHDFVLESRSRKTGGMLERGN